MDDNIGKVEEEVEKEGLGKRSRVGRRVRRRRVRWGKRTKRRKGRGGRGGTSQLGNMTGG